MPLIFDLFSLLYVAVIVFLVVSCVGLAIGLATTKREWTVEYQGHFLRVENKSLRETLYVDGEIQDQSVGYFALRARLTGRLPEGGEIKAHIGLGSRYHCTIFVDHRLILSE